MKALLTIMFCLITIFCYSQTYKKDSIIIEFKDADTMVKCKNCKIDFCGNIYDYKGTLLHNDFPLYAPPQTIYFTTDTTLLNKIIFEELVKSNKVKSIVKYSCAENKKIFGELAINEILFIETKDTTLSTIPLLTLLKTKKITNSINQIQINGFITNCNNIRYLKNESLSIKNNRKNKIYNIEIN